MCRDWHAACAVTGMRHVARQACCRTHASAGSIWPKHVAYPRVEGRREEAVLPQPPPSQPSLSFSHACGRGTGVASRIRLSGVGSKAHTCVGSGSRLRHTCVGSGSGLTPQSPYVRRLPLASRLYLSSPLTMRLSAVARTRPPHPLVYRDLLVAEVCGSCTCCRHARAGTEVELPARSWSWCRQVAEASW